MRHSPGCFPRPELGVKRKQSGDKQTSLMECLKLGVEQTSISGGWRSVHSQKATFALLVFEVRHIQKSEQAAQGR